MGVIFADDQEGNFEDIETGDEADADEESSAEDASDEDADDADESGSSDEEGDDKGDEDKGDEDEEAPKRKSKTPADWVAFRRGKKLEKQARKGAQGEDGGQEEGGEGDDELTRKVTEVVGKALSPIISQAEQQEIQAEIGSFVQENPEFQPYASKVAKWSQDPAWANVPIDRIFFAVAGKDLLRIGATRKAAADTKAKQGRTGGGQSQDGGGAKSWNDAPLDEVGKEIERIKSQAR